MEPIHGSGGSYAVTKGDLYNYNYDQNYYQVSGLDIKVQIRKKLPNITTTFNAESPHPSPPLGETTLPWCPDVLMWEPLNMKTYREKIDGMRIFLIENEENSEKPMKKS